MANTGQFNVCCTGELSVELHRPGIFGMFRRPIAADCLHFSTQGIQIETPAAFEVGEHVVLDLHVNDVSVEELPGVINSASSTSDKRYYDIQFRVDGHKRNRMNTLHCLRHIESHMRAQRV